MKTDVLYGDDDDDGPLKARAQLLVYDTVVFFGIKFRPSRDGIFLNWKHI